MYSNIAMFRRNLVMFSHNLGQKKKGVADNFKFLEPFIKSPVYHINCQKQLFTNLKALHEMNDVLCGNVINIGGDHSMAIGTVSSTLNNYDNAKVVWVDAHPDINTYESSNTKNYHGMPLAYLTGLQSNENFKFIENLLPFEHLMYIGIRDIDSYEKSVLREKNIQVITVDEMRKNLPKSMQKLRNFVGTSPVHLSFDVDALDPSVMPATGTPVPNGLTLEEGKEIVDVVFKHYLVNMDITELNLTDFCKEKRGKSLKNFVSLFGDKL